MKTNHTTLPVLCIILAFISVLLSTCKGQEQDPIRAIQKTIALRLANPDVCPAGDSRSVQDVVKSPGPDGIAHLPAGCYQVTTTIYLPPCTRLVGAGADRTILYRDPEKTYTKAMLMVSGGYEEDCVTQITGLSFLGVRDTQDTGQDYGIVISNLHDFRIDHSYFEGFGFAAVRVEGDSSGVIDHALFMDNFKKGIDNLGYGVVVYGKDSWEDNLQAGGAQATFVEDSLFSGNRHAIAASAGAHYVFRYNQVRRNVQACSVDAHGMGYGSAHGTQYVEIYHNSLQEPVYDQCGIGIRGGGGVIFENTIRGYKNPILLVLEWGTPENLKAEYPALDQIQGLYLWGNTTRGGPAEPQVDQTGLGFIQMGRDYFIEPVANYIPYPYPHPLAQEGPFDGTPWPP